MFSLYWIDHLDNLTSDYESRAERKPQLLSEYERGLFKFNANTPALAPFQNEPPRKIIYSLFPKAWKQIPLFSLYWINHLSNLSSDYESRAERKPMLMLEFVRGLFKFNANTPAVEVLLNEPPRKRNYNLFPIVF